jgi:hypothetical protein
LWGSAPTRSAAAAATCRLGIEHCDCSRSRAASIQLRWRKSAGGGSGGKGGAVNVVNAPVAASLGFPEQSSPLASTAHGIFARKSLGGGGGKWLVGTGDHRGGTGAKDSISISPPFGGPEATKYRRRSHRQQQRAGSVQRGRQRIGIPAQSIGAVAAAMAASRRRPTSLSEIEADKSPISIGGIGGAGNDGGHVSSSTAGGSSPRARMPTASLPSRSVAAAAMPVKRR